MTAIVVACLLFSMGLYGVLTRREIVAVLASVEVMLGGATLLLVVLASTVLGPAAGTPAAVGAQAVAVLLLAVVAAEAAVGLALLVALVRRGRTSADELTEVRG
jgi:NADH-quinone oxidoreductase subunit K